MPTPSSSLVIRDAGGTPIPQLWDPIVQTFAVITGDSVTGQIYIEPRPLTPTNSGAYAVGFTFKSTAGVFFGAAGQYKGAFNVWIMAFDSNGPPATNTKPLLATAIQQAVGTDQNWVLSPGRPYIFSTGLYIGISTTGGVFTASAHTDFTGTAEFA